MNPSVSASGKSEGLSREYYTMRPRIWIRDFILDWAIIVGVFYVVHLVDHWAAWPPAALIIGARLHALGLLAHDATHRTAFKNRFLNDLLGEVLITWTFFIVLDDGYRPWHFEHHRKLGTQDDPELSYRSLRPYRGDVSWKKIWRIFATDLLGLGIIDLLRFTLEVFPSRRPTRFLGPILLWAIFAAVTIYTGHPWILLLWTYSIVTGFWAVFRIRTWTEHIHVREEGKENSHRFSANPIARFLFFPHNTHCHYEHHIWPQVPYYHLPLTRSLNKHRPVRPLGQLFTESRPG
jgi:fatty acid desaturase